MLTSTHDIINDNEMQCTMIGYLVCSKMRGHGVIDDPTERRDQMEDYKRICIVFSGLEFVLTCGIQGLSNPKP